MIISIIILISLGIITLWQTRKNKITWVFSAYLIAVSLLLAASLLFLQKLSDYPYSTELDYRLYLLMLKIKLGMSDISRLYNFAMSMVLMLSATLFVNVGRKSRFYYLLFALPVILYFWLNDPKVEFDYYVYTQYGSSSIINQFLMTLASFKKYFNNIITLVYMGLPFYSLLRYFLTTNIWVKKRQAIVMAFCLFMIDAYIMFVFMIGPLSAFSTNNIDVFMFPTLPLSLNHHLLVMPITVIFIFVMVYLIYYYKPFNSWSLITKREMEKNTKVLDKNFRMIFHTYKNAFYTITCLAEQGKEAIYEMPEMAIENYSKIQDIGKTAVEDIAHMLDMIRDIKTNYKILDITNCINKAFKNIVIPPKISVDIINDGEEYYVYGDERHIVECFVNIITNSIQAIECKCASVGVELFGSIKVKVLLEEDSVMVEFTDDGCGIHREHMKHIFKQFFSTKKGTKNHGIGLNYVKNVIEMHKGHISVKSKPGEFTTFQLLFPLASERRIGSRENKIISL